MAKYVFGIDLGTTYSCIAYVDDTGRVTVAKNMEGENTTPSVVNFASPTNVVVGAVAKENAVMDPNNTVSLVKTLMGRSNFAINYNGNDITPEEVSSYILRKLAEDAAKTTGEEVKDVVITCPAYFGDAERRATRTAGEMAGLNVIEIISEPTAAAIYYGCTKAEGSKTILVYDLGGGTFDVTIMKISDGVIEEVCKDGNHDLGGKNWDAAVMQYLASRFCEETGVDADSFDEYFQQDLALKAEKAKQQLSSREEVPVMLDAGGARARISLTRATFDELTEVLLNESIEKTDAAIAVARERGVEVDEILLVGGSTYMPQVAKALIAKYGIEPKILDPNEAVAKGAAIYALEAYNVKKEELDKKKEEGTLSEDDAAAIGAFSEETTVKTESVIGLRGKPIVIKLVANKSYALKVLRNREPVCEQMIIKNSPMDDNCVSVTKQFGTAEANQDSVWLEVYENDFMEEFFEVDEELKLGDATLDLPGNLPEGAPIEVTFTLTKEGILEVTGKDLTTGGVIHATMQAAGGVQISEEEAAAVREKSKGITVT